MTDLDTQMAQVSLWRRNPASIEPYYTQPSVAVVGPNAKAAAISAVGLYVEAWDEPDDSELMDDAAEIEQLCSAWDSALVKAPTLVHRARYVLDIRRHHPNQC